MAQLKGPRRHAEVVLLAAEAPKPLPGARTPRNGGQIRWRRTGAKWRLRGMRRSRWPIKPSPLLKDALDRAHEGRTSPRVRGV
jgi:hypothetical protein